MNLLFLFILHKISKCLGAGLVPFERQPGSIAPRWTRIAEADQASTSDLKFILSNPLDEEFEELAYNIATPHSGRYRKHLSASGLATWKALPRQSFEKIEEWLASHSIDASVRKHNVIETRMSVRQAERLLNTTFHIYADEAGRAVHRVETYDIPEDLQHLVELVHPTVNFPHQRAGLGKSMREPHQELDSTSQHSISDVRTENSTNPCAGKYVTPACVRQFYGVDYTPPLNTNVTVWNSLSDGARINGTDMHKYLELFNPPAARADAQIKNHRIGPKIKPVYTLGANEELLDAEMLIGNGFPVKASYTYFNGDPGDYQWGPGPKQKNVPKHLHDYEDHYVDFLHSLAHDDFVPAALTSSEYDYDVTVTERYANYICKLWSQLGARGVSIFFCSNDNGSGGAPEGNHSRVIPIFTSGCPFVTSVGATIYVNDTELAVTKETWQYMRGVNPIFISGGGFSSIFARPKYQEHTVGPYVASNDLAEKFANVSHFRATGRGYPDVAAFGTNLPYVVLGKLRYIGGTSASTPTVAALIGVLNAYEESKGRPPIGFLNPWFYSNPAMFNDITGGGANYLCGAHHCHKALGYPVTKGWDAVTGLGSLHFGKLQAALDQMAMDGALD